MQADACLSPHPYLAVGLNYHARRTASDIKTANLLMLQ